MHARSRAPNAQHYPGVLVEGDGERAARRHRPAREVDGLPWLDLHAAARQAPGVERANAQARNDSRRRVLTEGALGRATLSLKFLRACSQARPPSMIADPQRPRAPAADDCAKPEQMHAHVAVRRGQAP